MSLALVFPTCDMGQPKLQYYADFEKYYSFLLRLSVQLCISILTMTYGKILKLHTYCY